MLIPDISTTRDRRSLGNVARFFFQPVQLHFELTDFLVKTRIEGFSLGAVFASRPSEHGREPLHGKFLPGAQLDGVHLQLPRYLIQGSLTLYRFQSRLGLILWTELTSRLHLCSFFRTGDILNQITSCPGIGVHYTLWPNSWCTIIPCRSWLPS